MGIGQFDTGPNHHVVIQELPPKRFFGDKLDNTDVAQFVETIRIVHRPPDVTGRLTLKVSGKDGFVDDREPFFVDGTGKDPLRKPNCILFFRGIVFVFLGQGTTMSKAPSSRNWDRMIFSSKKGISLSSWQLIQQISINGSGRREGDATGYHTDSIPKPFPSWAHENRPMFAQMPASW